MQRHREALPVLVAIEALRVEIRKQQLGFVDSNHADSLAVRVHEASRQRRQQPVKFSEGVGAPKVVHVQNAASEWGAFLMIKAGKTQDARAVAYCSVPAQFIGEALDQ